MTVPRTLPLLFLALSAQAALEIRPRHPSTLAGEPCQLWALDQGRPVRALWQPIRADLPAQAGETARFGLDAPGDLDVRVFSGDGARLPTPVRIRVLPRLPLRDPVTGTRAFAALVREETGSSGEPLAVRRDEPFRLRWERPDWARHLVLSYLDGPDLVRLDVTGLDHLDLRLRHAPGQLQVEALAGVDGAWRSHIQVFPVQVEGATRFAGEGAPGGARGPGLPARFRQAWGLAWFQGALAVSDAAEHTVRLLDDQGRELRQWGAPGQAGHADGGPEQARFHQPLGLATGPDGALWVADAGNHRLRRIDPDGRVATAAGDGQPGHLDHERPERARFHRPAALVLEDGGSLLVLDAGDGMVRRLRPGGRVSTVALADGQPLQVRQPGALALHPASGCLFLQDGAQVRRLTPDGRLHTLVKLDSAWTFQDPQAGWPFNLGSDLDGSSPAAALAGTPAGLLVARDPKVGPWLVALDLDAQGDAQGLREVTRQAGFTLTGPIRAAADPFLAEARPHGGLLPLPAAAGLCLLSTPDGLLRVREDPREAGPVRALPCPYAWTLGLLGPDGRLRLEWHLRSFQTGQPPSVSLPAEPGRYGLELALRAGDGRCRRLEVRLDQGRHADPADPLVRPRAAWVQDDRSLDLEARDAHGRLLPCAWRASGGELAALDPGGCRVRFRPPRLRTARVQQVVIQAESGGRSAEAIVLVLAQAPFVALGPDAPATLAAWGAHPVEPQAVEAGWTGDSPYLCTAPGPRPDPTPVQLAGVGLPVRLPLASAGALEATLVREDVLGAHRQDVTGRTEVTVPFQAQPSRCELVALRPPERPGPALLVRSAWHVRVCGLSPWMARVPGPVRPAALYRDPAGLLVADPGAHAVWRVHRDGRCRPLAGRPGTPGWQTGPASLLDQPVALAAAGPRGALVVDRGNHVLAQVSGDGYLRLLAGIPGRAGHQDGFDALAAQFREPAGACTTPDGLETFVADRGNAAIRRIGVFGGVSTLAGHPNRRGAQDGPGAEASFTDLGAMAWVAREQALYVVDGHALRRIDRAARVTTVAGRVEAPGFRDGPVQPGQPCLNAPGALWHEPDGPLYLADTGNHCVRALYLGAEARLSTVAGDPGAPGLAFGLCRDGSPGPLGEGYAGLEAPVGLAGEFLEPGLLVATGDRIAALVQHPEADGATPGTAPRPLRARLEPREGVREPWEPCRVEVDLTPPGGRPFAAAAWQEQLGRPLRFTAEFRNGDGSLAQVHPLRFPEEGRLWVADGFTVGGACRVVVRMLTDQGLTLWAEVAVPTRPPAPAGSIPAAEVAPAP